MTNSFFTATGNPGTRAAGSSAVMRAQFTALEAAFDKFPTLTANAGKALIVNAGATAVGLTTGTLALAGNFATTGAFALTLAVGAAITFTLPLVSGTAATLAGTETFTNKTVTSPSIGGTVTGGATYSSITLTTPALGTPSSGVLTNCTGYPTSALSGTVGVAQGGTNITSYAVGDLIYASATTTLSKIADVATGNALISGGVATAPAWGKIGLTTHVSGVLPVANGGTATSTQFTAGSVIFAGTGGVYTQDNANLFWDDTNNALGIGTSTPLTASRVTVFGSVSVTGTDVSFGIGGVRTVVDLNTGTATGRIGVVDGGTATGTILEFYTSPGSAGGTPRLTIGSSGIATFSSGVVLSAALTYGGVALSNSVTGTGSMVLSSNATLVAPALGTPASGVGTNITGLKPSNLVNMAFGKVNYSAGTPTLASGSLGIASITDNGTGDLTITMNGGVFANANYVVTFGSYESAFNTGCFLTIRDGSAPTSTAFRISSLVAGTLTDPAAAMFQAIGSA